MLGPHYLTHISLSLCQSSHLSPIHILSLPLFGVTALWPLRTLRPWFSSNTLSTTIISIATTVCVDHPANPLTQALWISSTPSTLTFVSLLESSQATHPGTGHDQELLAPRNAPVHGHTPTLPSPSSPFPHRAGCLPHGPGQCSDHSLSSWVLLAHLCPSHPEHRTIIKISTHGSYQYCDLTPSANIY